MKLVKSSTKTGKSFINQWLSSNDKCLLDCYKSYSSAKQVAYDRCIDLYLNSEEHRDFCIISHNSQTFTVAWLCKEGLRVETAYNSYLVLDDNKQVQ